MNFQTTTTFLQSPSSSHYILQHKKKLTISLPIVNSNELNHKDGKKKIACSHHLLLNPTTIEEGDDIAAVTFSQQNHQKSCHFLVAKPLKKVTEVVVFFLFITTEP
jgi:hypothetical protein